MTWHSFSAYTADLIDQHLSPNVRRYLELMIPAIVNRKENYIQASTVARRLVTIKNATERLHAALVGNQGDIDQKAKRLRSLLQHHHRDVANLIEGAVWATHQPDPYVVDFDKRPDVLDALTDPLAVASFISMLDTAQRALASKHWVFDRFHLSQTVIAQITLKAIFDAGIPMNSGANSDAVKLLDAVLRDALGEKANGARDQLRQWRKNLPE